MQAFFLTEHGRLAAYQDSENMEIQNLFKIKRVDGSETVRERSVI